MEFVLISEVPLRGKYRFCEKFFVGFSIVGQGSTTGVGNPKTGIMVTRGRLSVLGLLTSTVTSSNMLYLLVYTEKK